MYVLNPIAASFMLKINVSKTKTDKVDTFVTSTVHMTQDYLKFLILKDLVYIKLKELGRYHQKAVKQRIPLKIQLISYIDQVSPVLQYFFKSGVHQNSVHTLLKEIPTPNSIASMYKTHLPTAILVKIQPEN